MPQSAIDAVAVDHIAPLARLAAHLPTPVRETAHETDIPEDVAIEARLSGLEPSRPATVERIGEQVPVACPDCGGPLWQIGKSRTAMFRCHVGHALSGQALLNAQNEEIERSLWVAVRSLSERAATLNKLADNADRSGARLTELFRERANEAMGHSENARRFLLSLQSESATPQGDSPSPRDDSSAVRRASPSGDARQASRERSRTG